METQHRIEALFEDTEELLAQLTDEHGPHVDELRQRLEKSIRKTRSSLGITGHAGKNGHGVKNGKSRPEPQVRVRDVAASFNDYVQRYPWMALATGVLVASSVGIMATSALKRSVKH